MARKNEEFPEDVEEKLVFQIDIVRDISGRKNFALKPHISLLEELRDSGKIDLGTYNLIRSSYLDSLNGFYRSIKSLVENIFDFNG